jgi:hypothetical protein
MQATRSFEKSVHRRPTRRHIPEEGILHVIAMSRTASSANYYNKFVTYWARFSISSDGEVWTKQQIL